MDWQFESVEQAVINATYWNVNLYNTPGRNDGFMREDFSLIGIIPESLGTDAADTGEALRNLDVATRPYVMAASAEPVHQHFGLRSKVFELVLRGKPVGAPTVDLSYRHSAEHRWQPVHYPDGFEVFYNGRIIEGMAVGAGTGFRYRSIPPQEFIRLKFGPQTSLSRIIPIILFIAPEWVAFDSSQRDDGDRHKLVDERGRCRNHDHGGEVVISSVLLMTHPEKRSRTVVSAPLMGPET